MSYTGGGRIVLNNQREAQISRFRTWVLLAVPLAAIFFQVYIGALVGLAQDSLLGTKNPLGMNGVVKTLVGYFAASVSVRFDVDNVLVRLLLAFFFFVFHQFFYWVMRRALLGQQVGFDLQQTLLIGLLNALVGISLFHFLDKLRETV
jgi:rod shape-determining protein MreD